MVGGEIEKTEGSVWEMEEAELDQQSLTLRVTRPSNDRHSTSALEASDPLAEKDHPFGNKLKLETVVEESSPNFENNCRRKSPSRINESVTEMEKDESNAFLSKEDNYSSETGGKFKETLTEPTKTINNFLNRSSKNIAEEDYQQFVKLLQDPAITHLIWNWMKTNVNSEESTNKQTDNSLKTEIISPKTNKNTEIKNIRKFITERALLYLIVAGLFITQVLLYYHLYSNIYNLEHGYDEAQCRYKRDAGDNAVLKQDSANVEFFNPKIRQELEEKERAQGNVTGEQHNWVWLTSYSRIPLVAIQGFCSATKEYCPPGAIGPPGVSGEPGKRGEPGVKGEKGERGAPGDTGARGLPGAQGDPGPRGPKGNQGPPGTPGLDGRDGVPGEPGLDGMPGRNGRDGKPGLYGSPGTDGIPGKNGYNGTDGIPGKMGPQGPPGLAGPRGLPGPRGKSGKPGTNGTPGDPAVCAYKVTVNGTESSDLLIPPTIIGNEKMFQAGPIVVNEGDNLRLRCGATGHPYPTVEWKKIDKRNYITQGKWNENALMGSTINITKVNREHMGTYMCIASNGIPPPANQSFEVEVHFPPLIHIENQYIAGYFGANATMYCNEEAFPEGIKYWERKDGRVVDSRDTDKYNVSVKMIGDYRFQMQLDVFNVTPSDIGIYYCISRNEIGTAKGALSLYEKKPNMGPPPITGLEGPTFGQRPPEKEAYDELCPPAPPCTECADPKEFKCRQGIYSLYELLGHRDLEIRPLDANSTYPGLPNRTLECQVYAVGKPVFHRLNENVLYGSWMRDANPRPEADHEKYWVTMDNENQALYEYNNKTVYSFGNASRVHRLEYPFVGNAHLIYNGSFFYSYKNKPQIVKYELQSRRYQLLQLPYAVFNQSNLLYMTKNNYMDFALDENGLWVIYGLSGSNNTAVIKLDAYSMDIQFAWNISLKHQKAGEAFIVCGVLYVVDSVEDRKTNIRFALDLYKNQLIEEISIEFTNPFKKTTMIGYNHKNKELYTWDKGNQLTYPIKVFDVSVLSAKEDKGEPEANAQQSETGFDIN